MSAAILGRSSADTAEDPFGEGDPLEVARLVRRALADAGRRAAEVTDLVLVAEVLPPPERLVRFARRALGPAGTNVRTTSLSTGAGDHAARLALVVEVLVGGRGAEHVHASPGGGAVGIGVVLGPGAAATAVCVALPGR